jgi:hypothetical protein
MRDLGFKIKINILKANKKIMKLEKKTKKKKWVVEWLNWKKKTKQQKQNKKHSKKVMFHGCGYNNLPTPLIITNYLTCATPQLVYFLFNKKLDIQSLSMVFFT